MKRAFKVIDTHAHFGVEENKKIERQYNGSARGKILLDDIQDLKSKVGYDKDLIKEPNDLQTYLEIMEKNNIEQSWLHQLSFQEELGYEVLANEEIAKAIDKYPDRLKGFASVNPKSVDAANALKYAIETLGLHAFKLNPNDYGGFTLNDKEKLYPLYEMCCKLNIPVSVHTGITPGSIFRMKNNYPILLDDVAVDFPDLTIIVEHMGFPWNDLCYYMVGRHKNMYVTITAVANIMIHNNPKNFMMQFSRMIGMLGSEKILWGSDWTATPNIDEVLDYIKNASIPFFMRKMLNVRNITRLDIENILYNNALRILGERK